MRNTQVLEMKLTSLEKKKKKAFSLALLIYIRTTLSKRGEKSHSASEQKFRSPVLGRMQEAGVRPVMAPGTWRVIFDLGFVFSEH